MSTRLHGHLLVVLAACTLTATLAAQNPQTTATPPTPAPAGQRGGGGRGRGAMQTMTLETSAWTDGAPIPTRYTQAGHDVSPPLSWANAPDSTTSFVLIAHDLDTPVTPGTDDLLQWMLWNIPGTTHSLAEGQMQGPQLADGTRQISATGPYYRGPAAPATGPIHHYVFEIFALDAALDVPAVGAQPPATRAPRSSPPWPITCAARASPRRHLPAPGSKVARRPVSATRGRRRSPPCHQSRDSRRRLSSDPTRCRGGRSSSCPRAAGPRNSAIGPPGPGPGRAP